MVEKYVRQKVGTAMFDPLRSRISLQDKTVLLLAPHPDDDVIGCGALLLYLSKQNCSVHIAYAVSGSNGVTDRYAKEKGMGKAEIRRKEATGCCAVLRANPIFWNLPFYEKRLQDKKSVGGDEDVAIISETIKKVNPDVIFTIDEASDPHGTHGLVRQVVLDALRQGFPGVAIGYRVWEKPYVADECDLIIGFDESGLEAKKKLIFIYESQLQDPAFPCDDENFFELVKKSNAEMAKRVSDSLPYAECYKKIQV